ncbi:MAG TPA: hypothetical protein VFO55_03955 [Gemmatimonadaceae bacterium]|nr:hypothetical protein [Gemmatimonadaceae bacterium]
MRLHALALAAFAFAAPLAAQQQPTTPAVDLTAVRSELRNLIGAQEAHFADNGRYSPELGALKLATPDSVVIRILDFTPTAYAATGSLKGKAGASCVVMIGTVAAPPKTEQGAVAKVEGAVLCDGDR